MRKLFVILFMLVGIHAVAINIDKRTLDALEHVKQGYVLYGFEELKKAAATNDLAAQFYVAICYENGIGIEKSDIDAFKMYRKAAERGLPDAMFHIASFYKNGVVVTQDNTREKEWLQRYNQKGGQMLLPDFIPYYNEGVKHAGNFALNPNGSTSSSQLAQNSQSEKPQPIITQAQPIKMEVPKRQVVAKEKKSEVDTNIPIGKLSRLNTFALIIANENYMEVANVPNALHDGKIFAEYCRKTLGLPESNVRLVTDATLNKMKRQFNWVSQLMDAYKGDANIIFYYAGHGIPDESNRSSYLLPVDGYGTDVTTGYSLNELYALLTKKEAKSVAVFLDACFSGTNRDGNMLASARGIAIKAKQEVPMEGNIIVFSASQEDETAYPYAEKGHGLFTYYILKKLQETKGDFSFGELADYVTSEVKKKSVLINGKMQTPLASPSLKASDWRKWKLK